MKNFPLIIALFISSILIISCNKEISEPEHKADGSNVVYLKIDDKEEYILDARNKRLHRKTAGKFDDYDNTIVRYSEFDVNGRKVDYYSMWFEPYNTKKAELELAAMILQFDKQKQALDTAFLNQHLTMDEGSYIKFRIKDDYDRNYYINSIIDYKVIRLDTENKILTFSANCTYSRFPFTTPTNPRIYFYIDVKYSL